MKPLAVALTGALLVASATYSSAEVIPIQEEFVVSQQLHVDSSLDAIVTQLLGSGLIDSGATLHYSGAYDITELSPDNFSGSTLGVLSGVYLGDPWAIAYSSTMNTDILANKIWDLDSKGTWKKGPHAGKDFKDKGKLTEKPDNKADLDLEIETDGVPDKLKTTASNLNKEKGGGKLKVTGTVEVPDPKKPGKTLKEDLTIELDQATKTFTSKVTSTFLGVVVLENSGSFTTIKDGSHIYGDTNFDITVTHTAVPEPSALSMIGAGLAALLGWRWKAKRPLLARILAALRIRPHRM